jgi:alternate signal-mediated exported protein
MHPTMSTTTNAPVVVVTEEKKRRKGLLWVAGGTALLLGGSTFALWSASADIGGGSVTAGDLNITAEDESSFWDVSADRLDATDELPGTDGSQPGHLIDDTATWRMVPGDKVAAVFDATVTLEGDNLVGHLTVDGLDGAEGQFNEGINWSYEVYSGDQLLSAEAALPSDGNTGMFFSAPRAGQDSGASDANDLVVEMEETTKNVTVVIYGEFDAATEEREMVTVEHTLGELKLTLNQVRSVGEQFVVPEA